MTPAMMIRRAALVTAAVMAICAGPSSRAGAASSDGKIKKELFQTSDRCFACHNTLSTSHGEDISIGFAWRATMMANSARIPTGRQASAEIIDHPPGQGCHRRRVFRATCRWRGIRRSLKVASGEVFSHLSFGSDDRMDLYA